MLKSDVCVSAQLCNQCNCWRRSDVYTITMHVQVEQQVKSGRLAFRENSMLDDAALRNTALSALMSYHPFWLRLGMETVLNRRIFQDAQDDQVEAVVSSADLAAVLREEFLSEAVLQV
jgi:hypothetical protein